jgi:predicted RNA binding protein YcfA (HicA-like mRNA interferase family)
MSKLPALTGTEVITTLSRAGFAVIRTRSSHHFLRHADRRTTVVPVHAGETIGPGLMSKILRDCEHPGGMGTSGRVGQRRARRLSASLIFRAGSRASCRIGSSESGACSNACWWLPSPLASSYSWAIPASILSRNRGFTKEIADALERIAHSSTISLWLTSEIA